jgi:hypothetical protein
MDVLTALAILLGVPAAAFFIVALAIGINPVPSAAWGAICAAIAAAVLFAIQPKASPQVAAQPCPQTW